MKKYNKAEFMAAPNVTSAISGYAYLSHFNSSVEFQEFLEELGRRSEAIREGDMSLVEDFFISQVSVLDSVFNSLLLKAASYHGVGKESSMKAMELHMRLALKAQSQCRTTLEALSEIKNPRSITVTQQANIAAQQVVNNGTMNTGNSDHAHMRAGKTEKAPNELLGEIVKDERMDTRASQAPIRTNQKMETLAKVNRREDK